MSSTGTWMSELDSMVFLGGAVLENLAEWEQFDREKHAKEYAKPKFKRVWQRFLSSAVLNPPLHLRLPDSILPHVFAPNLIQPVLITLQTAAPAPRVLKHVTKVYARAFKLCRTIEAHSEFHPFIPVGKPRQRPNEGDLDVLMEELRVTLNALWGASTGLSNELGRLFTAHVSSIHSALAPSFIDQNERFGGAKARRTFFIDENVIFEHMGLGPRSADQLKSSQPVSSFSPNHLRHFDEIGDLIINRDSSLEGEVSRHVLFQGVSDLNAFLETFSYWKSLFEVSGMINAAKEQGGSLFYGHDFKFDISHPAVPAQSPEENYLFEIYLGNRKCVPRIDTIEHVFRLWEDPGLRGLKEKLAEWNSLSKDGSIDVATFIKDGMDAAARDARTAKGVGVFGKILSAVALPFRVFLPSAGTVAGVPGKMLSGVSSHRLSSVKWMNFGSDV